MKTKLFGLMAVLLMTGCACGRKQTNVAAAYQRALATQTKENQDNQKAMLGMHELIVKWHKKLKEHHLI